MKRVLIWDIPVRVMHWVLAGSTTAALVLGMGLGREHPLFGYHAWFAMVAAGSLVLRLVWAFAGSAHARFSGWSWKPAKLWSFLRGLVGLGPAARYPGHNPAASWVMLGILALVGALVGTGLAGGDDPHELLAQLLLVLIGLHLAGLLWHGIQHRENIARAMVDGRKQAAEDAALAHASRRAGVAVALLLLGWIVLLARGYDSASGTLRLPFFKQPLILTDGADAAGDGEQEPRSHDH